MKTSNRQRVYLVRLVKIVVFVAAILAATAITLKFGMVTSATTAAFSFLIIVLLSAFFGDLFVAIVTSVAATFSFDYFYLPPYGTLYIGSFSDWISLAAFLLASVIISYLASSAEENKTKAGALTKALSQIKTFGELLLSEPSEKITLTWLAREALAIFSLNYCSIHVYGEGKWRHYSGSASFDIPREVEARLTHFQDRSTDLLELSDESALGVTYARIGKSEKPLAILAVKSEKLPVDAIDAIAYMIGVRLSAIMKNDTGEQYE